MTDTGVSIGREEGVRRQTIDVLDRLAEKAKAFELTEPPDALEQSRQNLVENTYWVPIAGEANRGKSTFVNALIGRDILPADADVVVNHAFRIRHSEHEAYGLRFEDDSRQEITSADLRRYASLVVRSAGEALTPNHIIRWIEVDVPTRFLPEGVCLIDTPGLGAFDVTHAAITHRFVPSADAVIFALDSGAPMTQLDLDFVRTLIGATSDIFFLQTKTDQYDTEHWREVRRRNEEILQERFGGELSDIRVWPFSSKLLLDSAQKREAELLAECECADLIAALRDFLFREAGWGRSVEAIVLAGHFHAAARLTLTGRHTAVAEESKQRRVELQRQATQRKQHFDSDWGPRGSKSAEAVEQIKRRITLGKQAFMQSLQPGGEVATQLESEIETIGSLDEANELGGRLKDAVVVAVLGKWRAVTAEVRMQRAWLLRPFADAIVAAPAPSGHDDPHLVVEEPVTEFKNDYLEQLRGASGATMVLGMGSKLLGALGFVGGIGNVLFLGMAAYGWVKSGSQQLEKARTELRKHMNEVLQQVRRNFLDVRLSEGRASLVDEYFAELERDTVERIWAAAQRKAEETKAELNRLNHASKLDEAKRREKALQLQSQLAEWDELGGAIRSIEAELREIMPYSAQAVRTRLVRGRLTRLEAPQERRDADGTLAELAAGYELAPQTGGDSYARSLLTRSNERERTGDLAGALTDLRLAQESAQAPALREELVAGVRRLETQMGVGTPARAVAAPPGQETEPTKGQLCGSGIQESPDARRGAPPPEPPIGWGLEETPPPPPDWGISEPPEPSHGSGIEQTGAMRDT